MSALWMCCQPPNRSVMVTASSMGSFAFAACMKALSCAARMQQVLDILELYAGVYEQLLAVPVVRGTKTKAANCCGWDSSFIICPVPRKH
eukprot:795687-Amphidinium_carterae.1